MRVVISLALSGLIWFGGLPCPPASAGGVEQQPVKVLICTDEQVADLEDLVLASGGAITRSYRNVPCLAATLPAGELGSFNQAGMSLEKDRPVSLAIPAGDRYRPMKLDPALWGGEMQVLHATLGEIAPASLPAGYVNFLYTGAVSIWEQTGYGAGSVVAVVDTGVVPNICLQDAVIGAPGFPQGYNASGDGFPATDPGNHYHGTFVAEVIASRCWVMFDPADPIYQAISTYLPWPPDAVPLIGQAPSAKIYPVKVLDQAAQTTSNSTVLDGLDHVLSLKKQGLLDIDIVNMSLGWATLFDGSDAFDRFVDALNAAHILVVAAACNEGPTPNSVGTPATSDRILAVAALDYATSSRIYYEIIGLLVGADGVDLNGDEGPGMGEIMRPTAETRVTNFSSRGPTTDGRRGPDLAALGLWNIALTPDNIPMVGSGTSFASPTVAGAAALLNAYQQARDGETDPVLLRKVLLGGANPAATGPDFRAEVDQGLGVLDVAASFEVLLSGHHPNLPDDPSQRLEANVLPKPKRGSVSTWESGPITLAPSVTYGAVLEIGDVTSRVDIELFDIQAPDNSAIAYWPNALEVHLQSAKRSWTPEPVGILWYPYFYDDSFSIQVEDGPWTLWGIPWASQPMEPGLMKLTLAGDYGNQAPVSFRLRITREDKRVPPKQPFASGKIEMGGSAVVPVSIPAGVDAVTFDLDWQRKWDRFPSSDIDMYIFDPNLELTSSYAGASYNAPERVVIEDPVPGTWYVLIQGYELYLPDRYDLFVTTR